jgi:hypothetical protein
MIVSPIYYNIRVVIVSIISTESFKYSQYIIRI